MTEAIGARVRAWTFDTALPFWAEHGIDHQHGGYVEQLDLEGRNANAPFKRVRVIGRQIYCFAHASMLGFSPGRELATMGYRYLIEKAWLGAEGGWARRLSLQGEVLDATPDLYDIAFVLFALGWQARASGSDEPIEWALRTLDFTEARLRWPGGQGFAHETPAVGHRQQNPHMHLLEASLSLYEASKHERFAALARELFTLFRTKFFDPKTETLAEYFTDDLARAPGDAGRIVEPGHQMEWAWILAQMQRLLGVDARAEIRALVDFAERYGVDPVSGVTYNQVRDDGAPIDRGSRTWPNTERLKAAVAMHEVFGDDPAAVFAQSGGVLLDRYLNHPVPGCWTDAYDAAGAPVVDKIPASTLYHVFLAFAELMRVEAAQTV